MLYFFDSGQEMIHLLVLNHLQATVKQGWTNNREFYHSITNNHFLPIDIRSTDNSCLSEETIGRVCGGLEANPPNADAPAIFSCQYKPQCASLHFLVQSPGGSVAYW